jgi:hypothetical protein
VASTRGLLHAISTVACASNDQRGCRQLVQEWSYLSATIGIESQSSDATRPDSDIEKRYGQWVIANEVDVAGYELVPKSGQGHHAAA